MRLSLPTAALALALALASLPLGHAQQQPAAADTADATATADASGGRNRGSALIAAAKEVQAANQETKAAEAASAAAAAAAAAAANVTASPTAAPVVKLTPADCYAALEATPGTTDVIAELFSELQPTLATSDVIQGADTYAALALQPQGAPQPLGNAAALTLRQLFRLYLDKQATKGRPPTAAQQRAYDQITPQCGTVFEDIVAAYDAKRGARASSLASTTDGRIACTAHLPPITDAAGQNVDMTLCVWPPEVWGKEADGTLWADLSATLTNYGDADLCDVQFSMVNLNGNTALNLPYVPGTATTAKVTVKSGDELLIEATVPWSYGAGRSAGNRLVTLEKWTPCRTTGKQGGEAGAVQTTATSSAANGSAYRGGAGWDTVAAALVGAAWLGMGMMM